MLDARSSVYHTALTLQNAFMHAGTTSDVFLRENLEWLGKATNWAKFSATAALGVIHKGHFEEGMNILGPYLPNGNAQPTPGIQGAQYSEGGSLYALGLVNAGCGSGRTVGCCRRLSCCCSTGCGGIRCESDITWDERR